MNIAGYLGKWNYVYNGYQRQPTLIDLRNGYQLVPGTGAHNWYVQGDTNYLPIRWDPAIQGQPSASATALGASYQFNPHWAWVNWGYFQATAGGMASAGGVGNESDYTDWYYRLSMYPPYAALACDMVWDIPSISHPRSNGKAAVFNLLYPDGHVTSQLDSLVIGEMTPSSASANSDPLAADAGGKRLGAIANQGFNPGLEHFDDYMDILETEAQGLNPIQQNLYPGAPSRGGGNSSCPLCNREMQEPAIPQPRRSRVQMRAMAVTVARTSSSLTTNAFSVTGKGTGIVHDY